MDEAIEGLTDEQRGAIRAAHDLEIQQAVNQAREEFRAGVAGSRKPDLFDPGKVTIQVFFEKFEPFKEVMGLDGRPAMNAFLTYMDTKAQTRLLDSGALQCRTWEEFREHALQVLRPPQAAVRARFELKKASQRVGESVAEYGERLSELGKSGYGPNEADARDSALRDALAGGVLRDELAVHLINQRDADFAQLLAEAVRLDASYAARETMKSNENYTVSVMSNATVRGQEERSQSPRDSPWNGSHVRNVVCFSCHQPGHYSTQCPMAYNRRDFNDRYPKQMGNAVRARPDVYYPSYPNRRDLPMICQYCSKPNHTMRECRTKLRDLERQVRSMGGNQGYSGGSMGAPLANNPNIMTTQNSGIGPLNSAESQAYALAVDRQNRRDHPAGRTEQKPQVGLGFGPYNDQWSPETGAVNVASSGEQAVVPPESKN